MPTDRRQLRLVISAFLQSKGINDLGLEILLTDAVSNFVDATKAGRDAVRVRQTIVDGIEAYTDNVRQFEQMTERIEAALHVRPDGGDIWNLVIRHCIKSAPQTIEEYGRWVASDPYNSPKVHQIAQNPRLIISTWPAAFAGIKTSKGAFVPPATAVFADDSQ